MVNEDGVRLSGFSQGVSFQHEQSKFQNVNIHANEGCMNNNIDFGFRSIYNGLTVHFKGSGNNLIVSNHCRIVGKIVFDGDGQEVVISSNTSFEGVTIICSEGANVYIGKKCMFSYGIEIRNSDSHAIFDVVTKNRINMAEDVTIGDHVWLGAGCGVLPGVKIADGVIVGMKSVVSRSLESPHSVYVGAPAKKVRENVIWSRYKNNVYPYDDENWLFTKEDCK